MIPFPNEILEIVLQYTDIYDLLNCSRVCKDWYLPAYRIYYHTIVYRDNPKPLLRSFSRGKIGPYIKTLGFEYRLPHFSNEEFAQFIAYLPNLKKIDVVPTGNPAGIISHLKDNVQHLGHLQEINIGTDWVPEEVDNYFDLIYALRHSLKRVHIPQVKGKFLSGLPGFEELSHLSIANVDRGGDRGFDMFLTLRSHPQLVYFSLQTNYQEPQVMYIGDQVHLKLKSFRVELPNLTSSYINYMTRWFRLDIFQLVINDADGWLEETSQASFLQLTNYLKNVTEVEITIQKYIPLNTNASYTTCLQYWPLIKSFAGNYVVVTVRIRYSSKRNYFVSIKKSGKKLHVSFILDIHDFLAKGFNSDSILPLPFDTIHELHVVECPNSVEQCLKWIDCVRLKYPTILVITCNQLIFRVTEESMVIDRASFDNVPLYLPTVKILRLDNCNLQKDENGNFTVDLSSSKMNRFDLNVSELLCDTYMYPEKGDQHIVLKIEQENGFQYFECKRPKEMEDDYQFKFNQTNDTFIDHRFFLPSFLVITIKCLEIKELYFHGNMYLHNMQPIHVTTK